MVEVFDYEIPRKEIKISTVQQVKENIVYYGSDNLYPTNMESLIDASETASLCVKTETKFLSPGFVNETIGENVVGKTWISKNYTMNALLRDIAYSVAKFGGAYISITRDLEGKVKEVHVIDFTRVRFTEFDDSMHANGVLVGDFGKTIKKPSNKKKYSMFPLYKKDYGTYKLLAEKFGTTTSVLPIFENLEYYYPCNTYEPVVNDLATEYQIQVNRYEEITQGSPAKLVIRTDISTDEYKREQQINQIKRFAGSKGDRVLIIKTAFGEDGEPISNGYQLDKIEDTRDLSKFADAEESVEKNIRKAAQIPSILVSPNDGATVDSSAAQMEQAVKYYNSITRNKRAMIGEALTEVFDEDCTIKEFEDK